MTSPPSLPPEGVEGEWESCLHGDAALVWPVVTGLTKAEAARAYALAGIYVAPVRRGTKNPGSRLGGKWPELTSCDPALVSVWWEANPDDDIAIHVGRSGLLIVDIDKITDLRAMVANGHGDLMEALSTAGVIQYSRPGTDRAHYIYWAAGERYGNSAGALKQYGDVRGENGVIMAAPSDHADGGEYGYAKVGPLTVVPHVVRQYLSAPANNTRADLLDGEVTDWIDAQLGAQMELEELTELSEREWLSEYATVEAVRGLLRAGGGSVYEAARDKAKYIVFAAQEGRRGLVLALNNLWDAYLGIMADRQAGLLAGEARPMAAAEAELDRAIAGAVALAVERIRRYDTTAWQARLAEKVVAAPVERRQVRPRWQPRVAPRVLPRVSRRDV